MITAIYRGRCQSCETPILSGQDIDMSRDGDWKHAACPETRAAVVRARAETVCTTCWIVKPCECDDKAVA
jgi:hypothetical protein